MDMNLQKYKAFLKAVEQGSFTKAAEVLSYSQSGISRMIGDLEQEWGVSLLERGKKGVKLTSDGVMLLPAIRRVCEEHESLQRTVEEIHGVESGLIRIGTFSSVATHWLPKMIKEFRKDYPYIAYEMLLGDYREIEEWIREGRVDCGFLKLPVHSDLETIFVERDELMAILPEQHPYAKAERFPVEGLCGEPFMLLERGEKAEVSEIFERNGLKPDVQFTTWDDYAILSMVESGLGISVLPKLILKRIPYHIVAKPLTVPAYREIVLATKAGTHLSAAVKKFIEYLPYRA